MGGGVCLRLRKATVAILSTRPYVAHTVQCRTIDCCLYVRESLKFLVIEFHVREQKKWLMVLLLLA